MCSHVKFVNSAEKKSKHTMLSTYQIYRMLVKFKKKDDKRLISSLIDQFNTHNITNKVSIHSELYFHRE
jgi:hypothetical protein